ncbi:MAG TPA: hypothetical protein IGS17_21660 [Oscillatoriales cyanobacterium M59_W2019_021]|nr:hypothetical protein [Oscillatoriales cyanobacterium M4454_W2019_049]HIK53498.1 hypothetical protein [Oscillatoriales cyanobacterium M59_W2019_021]
MGKSLTLPHIEIARSRSGFCIAVATFMRTNSCRGEAFARPSCPPTHKVDANASPDRHILTQVAIALDWICGLSPTQPTVFPLPTGLLSLFRQALQLFGAEVSG